MEFYLPYTYELIDLIPLEEIVEYGECEGYFYYSLCMTKKTADFHSHIAVFGLSTAEVTFLALLISSSFRTLCFGSFVAAFLLISLSYTYLQGSAITRLVDALIRWHLLRYKPNGLSFFLDLSTELAATYLESLMHLKAEKAAKELYQTILHFLCSYFDANDVFDRRNEVRDIVKNVVEKKMGKKVKINT